MTTQELKEQYRKQATIYNKNLKFIKLQLNSESIKNLMIRYKANCDSHLAKILMLKGVEL